MRWLRGPLLASCLACHTVTPRCCLSWFSVLALSDFQWVGRIKWVMELAQHYSDTDSGKVRGKRNSINSFMLTVVSCPRTGWCNGGRLSHQWEQLGNKYHFCMGETEWPLCATTFDTDLILSWLRMGNIIVSRELPTKMLFPEHTKHKWQMTSVSQGLLLSPQVKVLNPGFSYLEHHLTTWPHET